MSRCRTLVPILFTCLAILMPAWAPQAAAAPGATGPAPGATGQGDRITVVLTSDREYNSAATWFDTNNRMQAQTDVPLPRHDAASHLWTGVMVYTRTMRDQRTNVMFQSMGNYAGCEIWVNEHRVVEQQAHCKYATVYCDDARRPRAHAAPGSKGR